MSEEVSWDEIVQGARREVDDRDVQAAQQALNYLCLAQLYLRDNVRDTRPLNHRDLKPVPTGHWGVCPPVNLVLAALGPVITSAAAVGQEVIVVHGAGHAGPSAIAHAYLTGGLGEIDPSMAWSASGLRRMVAEFPHTDGIGGEITALLPGHLYMGGQLGLALPVSHGIALDAPARLVVSLIGDGECETGATSASWLGARSLHGSGRHGRVLPVILLNGQRMGGPSLLAGLTAREVAGHFASLGYHVVSNDGADVGTFRGALDLAIQRLRPLEDGPSSLLVLTMPKGDGAPAVVGDACIAGTSHVHKAPLPNPHGDPVEFEALRLWLAQYMPQQLIDADGRPAPCVARALGSGGAHRLPMLEPLRGCIAASLDVAQHDHDEGLAFGEAIARTLALLHDRYGVRLFSPDELASNKVKLSAPWITEVLNEELCHAWAQGYIESGRRAIVLSYEAFAPIANSPIVQQLKYRSTARVAGRAATPSVVYLLTSTGWENTYSHANPGLALSLLGSGDQSVHLLTPADVARTTASLTHAVRKLGRCSVITKSKRATMTWPLDTLAEELRNGLAVWPWLSDDGPPDLVLLAAGDIAAEQLSAAAQLIRLRGLSTRFIAIHNLTALGHPSRWAAGIPDHQFSDLFPPGIPVFAATVCAEAIWPILLWSRSESDRFRVRGYVDPGRPLSKRALLQHCRMDAETLAHDALACLERVPA